MGCQHFRKTCCFHLLWKRDANFYPDDGGNRFYRNAWLCVKQRPLYLYRWQY